MASISDDPRLARLIGNPDPDAWRELYPEYTPDPRLRASKAISVSGGTTPEERADGAIRVAGTIRDPRVAYILTPLSDADIAAAASAGYTNITEREVPGVVFGETGILATRGELPSTDISTAQTVRQQQTARADEANTQRPEPQVAPEPEINQPSGPESTEAAAIAQSPPGPQTVPLEQSGIGVSSSPPRENTSVVTDDEGNESIEDFQDRPDPDVVVENVTIPGDFTNRLVSRPNILSEFSSYSYSLSLYLMQPSDYSKMVLTGDKQLFSSSLLIQTGGTAPVSSESSNARRNPYFDVDFYINDLEIESLVTGKSTQGAHNATRLRFNITEPYGISFLDRLRDAVTDYRGSDQNILSQIYLLVIRFYGYDEAGNIVQSENKAEETTDSNSAIEKFIPFIWENIKFTVANQSAVYECSAVAVNQYVGLGQIYTSVPYNIEISGQTLSELVNGEPLFSNDTASPDQTQTSDADGESESQSVGTIKQGLVAALNKYEQIEAKEKGALPNEYAIKLDESVGLANAKMAQFNEAYLANLPIGNRTNQTLAQQTKNDNNQRKYSLIAGQPIVQVLDLLVRASTYITDQQLVKITEDPATDRNAEPNAKNTKYIRLRDGSQGPVAWYKITTHIEPKEYDERRHEHSYKITYIISGYQVNDLVSEYFPRPQFRGVHKEYNYWFTGENTEVLAFEQQYNSLFYLRMAPQNVLTAAGIDPRQNRDTISKGTTQDISDQSEVMGTGESARPSADAASSLYSPADQAIAEIKIIGDPAWIQQSELLYSNVEGINYSPFLPDESINYDSQEPLFRISFNLPTDYDIEETGTMPVRKYNQVRETEPGSHQFVYRANRVVNNFINGEFTQQISSTLMFDTTRDTVDERNREDELSPPSGDNIISPGTAPTPDSSTNANTFGPRVDPFSTTGIDIFSETPGLDDD